MKPKKGHGHPSVKRCRMTYRSSKSVHWCQCVFKPNSQNMKTCIQNYCINSNQILYNDKDRQTNRQTDMLMTVRYTPSHSIYQRYMQSTCIMHRAVKMIQINITNKNWVVRLQRHYNCMY